MRRNNSDLEIIDQSWLMCSPTGPVLALEAFLKPVWDRGILITAIWHRPTSSGLYLFMSMSYGAIFRANSFSFFLFALCDPLCQDATTSWWNPDPGALPLKWHKWKMWRSDASGHKHFQIAGIHAGQARRCSPLEGDKQPRPMTLEEAVSECAAVKLNTTKAAMFSLQPAMAHYSGVF